MAKINSSPFILVNNFQLLFFLIFLLSFLFIARGFMPHGKICSLCFITSTCVYPFFNFYTLCLYANLESCTNAVVVSHTAVTEVAMAVDHARIIVVIRIRRTKPPISPISTACSSLITNAIG